MAESFFKRIKHAIMRLFGEEPDLDPSLWENKNQIKLEPLEEPESGHDEMSQLIPSDPDRPFHMVFNMLHQNDSVHQRRVPLLERMLEFFKRIEEECLSFFRSMPESEGRTCSIIFAVKPGRRSRFWVEYYPVALPQESHLQLLERLHAIDAPTVVEGPVSMMIACLLWGGIGRDQDQGFSIVPREWAEAGEGIVPDYPLSIIWPDEDGDDYSEPPTKSFGDPGFFDDIPLNPQRPVEDDDKIRIASAVMESCGPEASKLILLCPLMSRVVLLVERGAFQLVAGEDDINIQRAETEIGWKVHVMTRAALDYRAKYALREFESIEGMSNELSQALVAEGCMSFSDLSQIKPEDLDSLGDVSRSDAESIIALATEKARDEEKLPNM